MKPVPDQPLFIAASIAELRALRSAQGGRTTVSGTDEHQMFEAMAEKGWVKEVMETGDGMAWMLSGNGLTLAYED